MPRFYYISQIERNQLLPMVAHKDSKTGAVHLIRAAQAPKNVPRFINAYGVIKTHPQKGTVPIKKFRDQFNDIL